MRLGLPDARHVSLRSGAIVPDVILQEAVVMVLRGGLLVSLRPRATQWAGETRSHGTGSRGAGSRGAGWLGAGLLGPGDTWCGALAAMSLVVGTGGHDQVWSSQSPATVGRPVFQARAVGPAVVSIASTTNAVDTGGSDPLAWAALVHARDATARTVAAALAKRALPVRDRLRADLFDLAARFGRDTPRGRRIELPLTQDHLAELVGSTRETVNRALRGLAKEACIEGRAYVVRTSGWAGQSGGSA